MADNREELSPDSPSKRPRLDLEESKLQISDSSKQSSLQVSDGCDSANFDDPKGRILDRNEELSAPISDQVKRSEQSLYSGAVFEMQGAVSDPTVVTEAGRIDHNVTGK